MPAAPPPEVIFSAPTEDETDVSWARPSGSSSRGIIDPATLKGKIRARYLDAQSVERGEPATPAADFTFVIQRREPRPRAAVREAARAVPHAENRAARRDSRNRRPAAQALDADVCARRIVECSEQLLSTRSTTSDSQAAFAIWYHSGDDAERGEHRRSPLPHSPFDDVVPRRQRRERELRGPPARPVRIVADRRGRRARPAASRCDRAAAPRPADRPPSGSRRAPARSAGTADPPSVLPCSRCLGGRRSPRLSPARRARRGAARPATEWTPARRARRRAGRSRRRRAAATA